MNAQTKRRFNRLRKNIGHDLLMGTGVVISTLALGSLMIVGGFHVAKAVAAQMGFAL